MSRAALKRRHLRIDATRSDRVRELPGGQYLVDGVVGVVGVLQYAAGEISPGPRAEFVPADVLFEPESLVSLDGAPIVVGDHPPDGVGPGTVADVAGAVASVTPQPQTGELHATLRFWTLEAAEAARAGTVELSLGYEASFTPTPGVAPDGTMYDGLQAQRRYNHLAQVEQARAGRRARLRFDKGPATMDHSLTLDGTEYKVPAYIVGACQHHAIASDADKRSDMETAAVSIDIDGEATELVLPRAMVERWLSDLGAMSAAPPEAPEMAAEDMAMPGEEELEGENMDAGMMREEGKRSDVAAAVRAEFARRDAAAKEQREAERQVRDFLPASYDYDGKTPHQLRADAVANTDERKAKRAKALAEAAAGGDLKSAGRLEQMVEDLTRNDNQGDEPAITNTAAGDSALDFNAYGWRS